MVRDCLSFSFPDATFENLDFEEEPHLVAEATKLLKILQGIKSVKLNDGSLSGDSLAWQLGREGRPEPQLIAGSDQP